MGSKVNPDDLPPPLASEDDDEEGCECYQCAHGPEAFEEIIERGIREVGWVCIPIADGEPFPFCYTVGLKETFNHPEFIMQGAFDPRQMAEIVCGAVEKLSEDRTAFQAREVGGILKVKVHGVIQDGFIGCRDVKPDLKLEFLCRAAARYGDDGFEAKQLIFPDPHALLPWQPGFNQEWGTSQATLYQLDENMK